MSSIYDQFLKEKEKTTPTSTGGVYDRYLQETGKGIDYATSKPIISTVPPKPISLWEKLKQLPSAIVGTIGDYAVTSAGTMQSLGEATTHPITTIKKIPSVFSKPFMAGSEKAGTALAGFINDKGVANKVADTANFITGFFESAFSPITGLFNIAKNTPGAKQVADVINIPFSAAGIVGSWSTGKAIDWIPTSILPQKSKDIIKQPIQEVGALATQVILGGKIMKKIGDLAKKREVITPEKATAIIEQVKMENPTLIRDIKPIEQPELPKITKVEPKIIQVGEKSKVAEPVAKEPGITSKIINGTDNNNVPVKFMDIKAKSIEASFDERLAFAEKSGLNSSEKDKPAFLKLTGKVSGVAKSVEAKAIEAKLTKGFEDKAEFPSSSFKVEAKKVADLINSDIEKARAIVRGEQPTDIKAGALIAGMEEYAKLNPAEAAVIMEELANSPLASTISTGASETSFARMREADTATARLQEVKKAKEAKVRDFKKKKSKAVKDIKAETEKYNLTKEELSFSRFLDGIVC